MVDVQIARPLDGRPPVRSEEVLAAMRAVPRHAFVPEELRAHAHADSALPIGSGQTISQPYIVALVTEHLALGPNSKVLEVGAGSGYQAAVLAEITPHVFGIEIVEALYTRAVRTLAEQGYSNVKLRRGDGYFGWQEEAPFDGIIVSCAAEKIPPPLWEQLKPGGRIVIPVGDPKGFQELVVVEKTAEGGRRVERITPVRFVPLTGEGARGRESRE
jgi:protein-L-isoaspartate(D-aspartate) O-methyltransferase